MSQAFVKEEESEWLWDVAPNASALARYLTRDSGKQVYAKGTTTDDRGRTLHEMSNGLSYFLDDNNKWEVVL